jgi:hypothetical protein
MNDPVRRRARLQASLVAGALGLTLAAVIGACASDARPAASGEDPSQTASEDGGTTPDGEAPRATDDGAVPLPDGGTYVPPDLDAGPAILCQDETAVFNLTAMGPSPDSPADFITAWDREVGVPLDATKLPSLVLAGKNLKSGPLDVRLGPVVFVGGTESIPAAGAGSAKLPLQNKASTKIILPRTALAFKLAFGPIADRRLIDVVAAGLELDVNETCTSLTGTLRIDIAGGSGSITFGDGTTLAQVLGPLTADTDFDNVNDAWRLEFTSNRGDIPTVGYTP